MNIAVVNLRDIIKYIVSFVLVLAVLVIVTSTIKKEEFEGNIEKVEDSAFSSFRNSSFLYCLKTELPLVTIYDEKKEIEIEKTSEIILGTQLAMMHNFGEQENAEEGLVENTEYFEDREAEKTNQEQEEIKNIDVPETANTEIISEHNINARYTDTASSVQINNQTSFDINDILSNSNYELKNKNKVIIYHTHTCESYTPSDAYNYEMTGAYRTTDLNYTVSRVGDELEKYLIGYGKTVVHDKTYHDYPAYNGSYGRSLKTMTGVLENNQDAEITIDLHRDAVGSSNTYGPTVKIGDEVCAQVMFVIGSDGSGLYHPNWRENLKFAITVQQKGNEKYTRNISKEYIS